MARYRSALAAALLAATGLTCTALAQPANDLCANATVIGGLPFTDTVSNIHTATDDADVDCNSTTATGLRHGVWYTYTPASNCGLAFTETGSQDVSIAVYSATGPCAGLTQVYCTDAETVTYNLAANVQYYIAVGRFSATAATSGSYTVNANACDALPAAPANDTCATAETVTLPASITVDARGAGDDADNTCNSGTLSVKNGIWYTFTAPGTGQVSLVETSTIDTVVSVYTGTCAGLAQVHCSDPESSLFNVTTGTQYYVLLGNWGASSLTATSPAFALSMSFVSPPANDACAGAVTLSTFPVSFTVDNTGAADDVDVGTCNTGTVTKNGVWYTYTPSSNATFVLRETGTQDVVYGLFTGSCGAPVAVSGGCLTTDNQSTINLTGGTQYFILVGNQGSAPTLPLTPMALTFDVAVAGADTCDAATPITATPYAQTIAITGLTDDADVSCNSTSASAARVGTWHSYTPTAPVRATIAQSGANDTIRAVFTGTCAGLTEVACVDAESLSVDMFPGQTYYILTAMWSATTVPTAPYGFSFSVVELSGACCTGGTCATATFTACGAGGGTFLGSTVTCAAFTCAPAPANDLCANATVIPVGGPFPYTNTVADVTATDDVDTTCNSTSATMTRNGVWYSFTPTEAVAATIGETNGNDTIRAVFTGSCGSLTQIACSDTETGVVVNMNTGSTYYILTGMFSATTVPSGAGYAFSFSATPVAAACCTAGSCSVVTQSVCETGGGVYQGIGVTCDPRPIHSNNTAGVLADADEDAEIVGVTTRTITVADAGTVSDLNVQVNINHTWVGDLRISLTSPTGTTAFLSRRPGGSTATPTCPIDFEGGVNRDLIGLYTFDDEAATTFNAAALAATTNVPLGTYQASECTPAAVSLDTVFAGETITGTWTLTVVDADGGDTGTLNGFALIFNDVLAPVCEAEDPCRADFNDSGAVDVSDIFAFLSAWFNQAPGSDFDNSGATDVSDIFAFLSAWFAGCD